MRNSELLRQVYEKDPRPAVGFMEDSRVVWVNGSCSARFPGLMEEMSLKTFFPNYPLEKIRQMGEGRPQLQISGAQGDGVLNLTLYQEEERFFVGVWQPAAAFAVSAGDRQSAEGVQFLTGRLRFTMGRVFNHLNLISEKLEDGRVVSAEDNVERIGKLCQQLLRAGYLLQHYYASETDSGFYPETVTMGPFLQELFERADFYLEPAGFHLARSVSCRGVCCNIDPRQMRFILLTLIDLSAQQMPEGGEMKIKADSAGQEFCLTFSDRTTPFSFFTGKNMDAALLADDRDFIRIAVELIDRIVRRNNGRYLVTENDGGIRLTIRLPLDHSLSLEVRDQHSYRPSSSLTGWSDEAAILLSDL